jgi:hypothetical protein
LPSLAERDIAAGEEVCISYGKLSDAELLQTYGFLEPLGALSNPHNKVIIRQADVYDAGKVRNHALVQGNCPTVRSMLAKEYSVSLHRHRLQMLTSGGIAAGFDAFERCRRRG